MNLEYLSSSFWDDLIVTGGKLTRLSYVVNWGFLTMFLIKETRECSSRVQLA